MQKLHYNDNDYSITIVVDNITLGPALGGCRIWKYDSDEEAIEDCIRLAKGMTYKNSLCGLSYGGGKAVINLKNPEARTDALADLANMIDFFNGDYITAEDVGVTPEDLCVIRNYTDYVASESDYDASSMTAYGVYVSMKAACKFRYNNNSLNERSIAIQGAGRVGSVLAKLCAEEGALVFISDLYRDKAIEVAKSHSNISHYPNENMHTAVADIYAPCALGGSLNIETIPELNCDIVCGCANNQLATTADGVALFNKGITYCPDYLVNAGGVLTILVENHEMYASLDELKTRIATLYNTTFECLVDADAEGATTAEMADIKASRRLGV